MFGICNLGIVPIRSEASDKSEMVSQLLFGDTFKIMESTPKLTKIQTTFDTYEGWIDTKQFQKITENQYLILEKSETVLNGELIDFISYDSNQLMPIPLGSSLHFLDVNEINTSNFQFEGLKECGIKSKDNILKTAVEEDLDLVWLHGYHGIPGGWAGFDIATAKIPQLFWNFGCAPNSQLHECFPMFNDIEAFANDSIYLLDNPFEAKLLAEKQFEYINCNYNIAKNIHIMEELFQEISKK